MRIFRLLVAKHYLEEKQVAELAMVDTREARSRLQTMYAAGYVSFQEFSKSAGQRDVKNSIFLWTASHSRALELVCNEVDHAILNMRVRAASEVEKVRSLVDRAEAERDQGPGAANLLTDAERVTLNKFLALQDRLEISAIQLAEVSVLLRETAKQKR
jgi:hypothetical protein